MKQMFILTRGSLLRAICGLPGRGQSWIPAAATLNPTAAVIACALLAGGNPAPALAAASASLEQQLASARSQLVQMQNKLDNWLLSAARREEEVQHLLAARDARIAKLNVLLSEERKRNASVHSTAPESGQTEQRLRTLEAELSRLRRELQLRAQERETLRAHTRRLEQRDEERDEVLKTARQAILQSKRELGTRAAQIERLQQALTEAQSRLAQLESRLVKTSLSPATGTATASAGTTQPEQHAADALQPASRSLPPDALRQARAGARAAALEYLRLRDQELPPDGKTRPDRSEVHQAFRRMFAQQARVANLIGARGLYQVRAQDTLSLVAGHTTGEQANWPALFTANEHLMASPDQLIEGLVLIIPSD